LQDPELEAALARLYWRADPDRTIECAAAVLRANEARSESRVTALVTLATTLLDSGRAGEAEPHLEELVTLRLYSEDWYWLSICRMRAGQLEDAVRAAERAAELSPQYPELQEHLSALYREADRVEDAEEATRRAAVLRDSVLRP
jgi:tetratricopeptide (TPR) repeat protein